MAPRGPAKGSGKTGGRDVGRLGGRPRTAITLRIGVRVSVRYRSADSVELIEQGTVTEIDRNGATIALDNGDAIKVYV